MIKQKKLNSKIIRRKVSRGVVHIKASFNNTLVSVTDMRGNVISWSSSGSCGFKGSRKSTPFAAQTVTEVAIRKAIEQGIKQIEINVSGPGSGRETAVRSIQNLGLSILLIRDVTPIPHNGCRPTKKRRI
jgi:small subunit ribosomal protein S11